MKNILLNKTIAAMLCILMLFSSIPVYAEDTFSKPNPVVTPQDLIATPDTMSLNLRDTKEYNRFIIKYKNKKSKDREKEIAEAFQDNLKSLKRLNELDVVTTNYKTNTRELLSQLQKNKADSNIEYIQPDYELSLSSNDSYFDQQWGVYNQTPIFIDEQEYRIDANIIPAWEISQGNGVAIAVIDTGIDITHEDLVNNIWQNPGEIPDNGIDDDQNGYIDDINGWNFVDENNLVHNPGDNQQHGTAIAGVIAAEKDNNTGIAGVAPLAKILPLKAFHNGYAYTSDIIEAIGYAASMGGRIVNCSWESAAPNPILLETMAETDILFVCAAGNSGENVDQETVSPATFDLPNTLTVAAINNNGYLSNFSNYGTDKIHLAAPGENIITTSPGNDYQSGSGTSFAAAFVSGQAALLLSNDSDLSAENLKDQIISSSEHYSTLLDKISGGHKINAHYALTNTYPDDNDIINIPAEGGPVTGITLDSEQAMVVIGSTITLQAQIIPPDAASREITWSSDNGDVATVNESGQVTGISLGTAIITATTVEGGYTAECSIEVVQTLLGEGITLNKKRTYLTIGDTETLQATVAPEYADQPLIWWSSNDEKVSIDQFGKLTAIDEGFVVIIVKTEDESAETSCIVGVVEEIISAQSVTITTAGTDIAIGEDLQLFAKILPENTTNQDVTWTSSDETVATVAWDGIVRGVAEGSVLITAQTIDGGYPATCNINVSSFTFSDPPFASSATPDSVGPDEYERYLSSPYDIQKDLNESVNQKTSNLSIEKNLLSLPGRNGLDLDISVRYDSLQAGFGEPRSRLSGGKYTNSLASDTLVEQRFNLGAGWSFNFPFIEILTDSVYISDDFHFVGSSGTKVYTVARYLHLPTGEILRISTAGGSFWRYDLNDMVVDINITEFNNGSVNSQFRLKYKDGLKNYFDSAGRLIGVVDRYGNTIKYVYTTDRITITDTLGRITIIKYSGSGDDKKVHIIAPGDSESNPTYELGFSYLESYGNYLYPQYILNKIINMKMPDMDEGYTSFEYNYLPAIFTWHTQNHNGLGYNYYACLERLSPPTPGSTRYTLEPVERRWISSLDYAILSYPRLNTRYYYSGGTQINKKTYEFSGQKKVRSTIRDENNVKTFYEFDEDEGYLMNEVTRFINDSTNPVLNETTYEYQYNRLPSKQTTIIRGYSGDNINTSTSRTVEKDWNYNQYGDLLQEVDELGRQTNYTYETNFHQPTSIEQQITGALTKRTEFTVNPSNGNITQMKQRHFEGSTDKSIITNYPSYDSYGNLLSKVTVMEDSSTVTENYQYSSTYNQGYLTKKIIEVHDYEGNTETIEENYTYYMNTSLLASSTNGNNHTTSYEYDSMNRLTKETNPDDSFKTITYDTLHNDITLTLENGHKIRYDYDGLSRLLKKEELVAGTDDTWITLQENSYDLLSRLIWSEDAADNRTSYEYDLLGRVKIVTNPDTTYRLTKYYDADNKKVEINEEGTEHTCYYDHAGQLIQEDVQNDSTLYTTYYNYDKLGNLIYIKDPEDNEINYEYDDLGRLVKVINAKGEPASYQYNNLGNLVKTTVLEYDEQGFLSRELITTKAYDELGRLIKNYETYEDTPSTTFESFVYDPAGNLIKKTDMKGNTITNTYDSRNRLLTVISRDPQEVMDKQYIYNYADLYTNNKMTVTDERGIVTCEYYPNGRLKSQSLPGSTTEKTSYEYYNNGNLKTITDPFGLAVEYDYDSNNRMDSISIGSKVFDYEYHEDGMLKSLQYPFEDRVVKSDFSYFDNNQLEILQNTIDSNIDSYEYTYDRQGNVTSLIESITCTPAIKPFDQEIVYEYDARGNRTQMQTEIFYQMVMGEFGYDTLNQLSQYIKDDNQHQYQYDVNGLRVKKTTPDMTTQYIYGLGNKTIAETDETGAVTAQIIWGHKPLARIINGQYYYYLYNGHGDVVQVIDENGNIVNSYAYDEWGNHEEWKDPVLGIDNPIRYAGEYYDEESGLYYLRARYYDPTTGRFISRDTNEGKITNPLSLNKYIYAYNAPLNYVDPDGNIPIPVITAIIGGLAGGIYEGYQSYTETGAVNWGDVAKGTAIGAIAGGTLGAGAGFLAASSPALLVAGNAMAIKGVDSVWKYGSAVRGNLIEKALGGWGTNFPVIDKAGPIVNGVRTSITSIKSIDVFAKTYQNSNKLYSTVMGYADKLSNFNSTRWGNIPVVVDSTTKRILELALPTNISGSQMTQINNAITDAAKYGVEITIKYFK